MKMRRQQDEMQEEKYELKLQTALLYLKILLTNTVQWIIEKRNQDEIHFLKGKDRDGRIIDVRITPDDSEGLNYAFDITPNKYISGLITEKGVCEASKEGLKKLFK